MSSDLYPSYGDFIDAFVATLQANATLIAAGVTTADSWMAEEQPFKCIWIRSVDNDDSIAGMNGGQPAPNNEVYSVVVECDVYKEGGNAKAARDDCKVLVGEVLKLVSTSKRFNTTGDKVVSMRSAGFHASDYIGENGRGHLARVRIVVSGRR